LKEIKNISIFIDNEKIKGEVIDVDKWGKITISVPPETKIIPVEIGKRVEIFFEKEGKKFLISGKIFSQGRERMIFLAETDVLQERRKDERYEISLIPVRLSAKIGFFHREDILGSIIDISLSGIKIETNLPLKENIIYDIETIFQIKRKSFPFSAKAKLIYKEKIRNVFINGLNFVEIDPISFENLKNYIKIIKHEVGKDALNY